MNGQGEHVRLLIAGTLLPLAVLVWSGIRPYDRATWIMEVAPVMVVLRVLWMTQQRFPLTTLETLSRLHDRQLRRLSR
jgi:uncharacterized membrane protein YjdF